MRKLGVVVVALLVGSPAYAHFILTEPPADNTQDSLGNPQQTAKCGPGPSEISATNAVTDLFAGTTMTLTIDETITHPGHYRVAVAQTAADLPADPPVTADSSSACGSVPIDSSPPLPLLADGVFVHTTAFKGPQTTQIQLPPGMLCDHCVVQVLEFMSNHPTPCFYYHCATVNIGG